MSGARRFDRSGACWNHSKSILAARPVSGDNVTFIASSANFSNANVGKNKTVNVGGIQVTGTDAANYALASDNVTTTADISSGTSVQDTAARSLTSSSHRMRFATPYGVAPCRIAGAAHGQQETSAPPVEATRLEWTSTQVSHCRSSMAPGADIPTTLARIT